MGGEADSLLASVFLDRTAAAARSRIIASGRGLRLRVEAASLLDDLGHTVRTRFPYPVASRWRETEAQTSAGPSQGAYAAVLDTTEILLCYTAQLALALAWSSDIELGSATAIKDKLSAGRGGPGFGDWAFVLQEVATSANCVLCHQDTRFTTCGLCSTTRRPPSLANGSATAATTRHTCGGSTPWTCCGLPQRPLPT